MMYIRNRDNIWGIHCILILQIQLQNRINKNISMESHCTNLSIMAMHTHKIESYFRKTTRNNQYILKPTFMEHKLITTE